MIGIRLFFILFFVVLCSFKSEAQLKCNTATYLENELKIDPTLRNRMMSIDAFATQNPDNKSVVDRTFSNVPKIIKIPVVFHVLYHKVEENVTGDKIVDQLKALNRDFRRRNSDTSKTPSYFLPLAADMEIEFELAKIDPSGVSTSGIDRKYTPISYWYSDDKMKFNSSHGTDSWDPKSYLNIWICKLDDVLGYSTFPGFDLEKDGVVISFNEINNSSVLQNTGRTLVHEVGHWLNLKHLWGDGFCGDDGVDDTPKQSNYTPGCPAGIRRSCGNTQNGDMYMNFMDFTSDVCMNLFTQGQKNRVRALFENGGFRNSILYSKGFNTPSVFNSPLPDFYPEWMEVKIYPNPAVQTLNINVEYDSRWIGKELNVIDMLGKTVIRKTISSKVQSLDISRLSAGIYFIRIEKDFEKVVKKFVKLN